MERYRHIFDREPEGTSGPEALRLSYITQAKYSEDWNSRLHTHSCTEVFFVTDGHGRFRTQDEEFPVAIHDLVIVNAQVLHTELSQTPNPLEYIVLGVEGLKALGDESGYTMLHLHSGWNEMMSCLNLMLRESREGMPGHEEVCRHLLEVVLIRMERQEELSLGTDGSAPRASRECGLVRRYIDNHFKEDLSLAQLAQMAHINKYHLAHTFQKEFGTSPISYLLSLRIEESCFLLRETDHSLTLIAQILGFSSLSYFSQCFRKAKGMSPMAYRKQNR